MSKRTAIWLIVAASLVLVGCIIFVGVMTLFNWDFTKLSTAKYESNTYEIREEFKNISLKTDTANILFVTSDEEICKVSCYERENEKHSVVVQNGTLIINVANERKWYENIGINFGTPKITVYIPRGGYGTLSVKSSTGDVQVPKDFQFESIDISGSTGNIESNATASQLIKIKTSTGNIRVESISAGALDLSVSTGSVTVSDVACTGDVKINVSTGKTKMTNVGCKNVISSGSTGGISLKNVIAAEKCSIKRSTGSVKLDKCDAAEISIKTDTGDVRGSLLTDKIFITQTDTGSIHVPKTTTGGKCQISTDTGDIHITVNNESK